MQQYGALLVGGGEEKIIKMHAIFSSIWTGAGDLSSSYGLHDDENSWVLSLLSFLVLHFLLRRERLSLSNTKTIYDIYEVYL